MAYACFIFARAFSSEQTLASVKRSFNFWLLRPLEITGGFYQDDVMNIGSADLPLASSCIVETGLVEPRGGKVE